MKKIYFCAAAFSAVFASAQVGINTPDPKATLDVVGKPLDTTTFDGIIAPRISGDDLRAKIYTSDQTGALIYVTIPDTSPSGQTADVTSTGYYYYDGNVSVNKWIKVQSGNALEPWNVQATSNPANANTQNIYQQGKVAIGTTSADAITTKQLDVVGDFKTNHTDGTNFYGIETNETDLGIPMNTFFVANDKSLATATQSTFLYTSPGQGAFQSLNGSGGGNIAVFSDTTGGTAGIAANDPDQSVTTSIWTYSNSTAKKVALQFNDQAGKQTNVAVDARGVNFRFSTNMPLSDDGNYTFPRNNGSQNQVLTTDGAANALLSWKDVSAINMKIRPLSTGTVSADDFTILVRGNVSLPAADAANLGHVYNFINDTNGTPVIAGTFRINGGNFTNYGLNSTDNGRGITVQSTGTEWVIINRY